MGFAGHPRTNLTEIHHKKSEPFVFVDGTVGKVFARTGLVEKVRRYRGNQVYATKMRPAIDNLMAEVMVKNPVRVDGGACIYWGSCVVQTLDRHVRSARNLKRV